MAGLQAIASDTVEHATPPWQPFWIRRSVLFAFTILFTAMWLALILVWQVAVKHNGLALTLSTNHYAWTYGPTAIFVVVVGLWRQVDYYCKTTQAWQDMSRGPTPAHRSVLLDYMMPLLPNAIVLAFRNRHFAVVASTLAFLVLKLITIVSTTLLVAELTPVTTSMSLQWATSFSATSLWRSVTSTNMDYAESQLVHPPFVIQFDYLPAYGNITSSSAFSYIGALNGQASNETGIQDDLAFTTWEDPDPNKPLTSVTAYANVFEPRVICEDAKVTPRATISGANPVILELTSDTCSVGRMNMINKDGIRVNQTFIYFQSLCLDDDPTYCPYEPDVSLFYRLQRVNCDDKGTVTTDISASDPSPEILSPTTPTDYRLLLLTATKSKSTLSTRDITGNLSAQIESSALICQIRYDVGPRPVTKDMTTQQWSFQDSKDDTGEIHLNITSLQYSELIFGALYESYNILGTDPAVQQVQYQASYPMFKLMGQSIGDQQSFKPFLNATTMRKAAERVFGGIGARLAQQKLLVPATIPGTGTATSDEYRLQIRVVSLWLMVAGFILMTGLAVLIMVIVRPSTLPADPTLIATLSTILAPSASIRRLLDDCGGLRLSQLRGKVRHHSFQTFLGAGFELQASKNDSEVSVASHDENVNNDKQKKSKKQKPPKQKRPWVPLMFRRAIVATILLLPCIAIGILELLYQLSNQRQGLFAVNSDTSVNSYVVRYISTLSMLLISTLFNSVDFIIATFASFSALRSGPMPTRQVLYQNLLGVLPPLAFYQALRIKQYGAAASNAASTIGSVLTIVVSGLWLLNDKILLDTAAMATLESPWNTGWNSSDDGGAASLLNNIQHGSASTPNTVFGDLVFPRIANVAQSDNRKMKAANDTYSYEFDVPALHPVLSCDVVPSDQISISYYSEMTHSGLIDGTIVTVRAQPGDGCDLGTNSSSNFIGFDTTWSGSADLDGDTNAWGGNLVELRLGSAIPYKSESGPRLKTLTDDQGPYPPTGCPSIGAIFGYFEGKKTNPNHVTVIVCKQKIQQITVDAPYKQDLSIDHTKSPPTWTSNAATNFTNASGGPDSFMYHVVPHLGSLTSFNWNRDSSMGNKADPDASDVFFNHLIWGPNGTSHADLLGPANAHKLIDAVNNLYKKYMLEVIDRNFRGKPTTQPSSRKRQVNSGSSDVLTGTIFRPGKPRLLVTSGSKIALQAMLGTMTLLLAFAYWQADVRGTLPRNPWPIASTMALLVDSGLLKQNLSISNSNGRRHGKRHAIDDLEISLGWWERDPSSADAEPGKGTSEQTTSEETAAAAHNQSGSASPALQPAVSGEGNQVTSHGQQSEGEAIDLAPASADTAVAAAAIPRDLVGRSRFGLDIGQPLSFGYSRKTMKDI